MDKLKVDKSKENIVKILCSQLVRIAETCKIPLRVQYLTQHEEGYGNEEAYETRGAWNHSWC